MNPWAKDVRIPILAVLFLLQAVAAWRMDPGIRPASVALSLQETAPRISSTVRAAADLTGLRVLVGHVFWFRLIQYYGDSGNAADRYSKLYAYSSLAADLNPYFTSIYQFGAAPLAFHVGRPGEAIALLERGIRANPGSIRLKVLLAAIGYQNRSEWEKVIPLLEAQVASGEAPTMLVNILANTYKSAGRFGDAIRLWRNIQRSAATDEQRILAGRKLRELYGILRDRGTSP